MKQRSNYRLHPDASQRASSARLFRCVRAVWNDAFARRRAAWTADRSRIGGTRKWLRRWHPSSQRCPCCGWEIGKLGLDVRAWGCPSCGEHHARDIAAALNILAEGIPLKTLKTLKTLNDLDDVRSVHDVAAGPADTRNDCAGQVRPGKASPILAPPETSTAQVA